MNINKRFFFIILSLFLFISQAHSEDKKELLDEELPAINPFLGGGGASVSSGDGIGAEGVSQSNNSVSLKNMKLSGVILGESKRFAIFTYPDGRTVKYKEDSILSNNLMILDIF